MLASSRIRDRCSSELDAWVGASALHSPHAFDALRNWGERGIGDALAAQSLCRPDQTSRRRDRAGYSRPAQCDCSPVPGAPGNSGCVPICLAMGGRARSGAGGCWRETASLEAQMTVTTLTSREFNQDTSGAKKAARRGPGFITDRGRPAHVLVAIADSRRLAGGRMSLAEALAQGGNADFTFDPPRVAGGIFKPADLG